MMYDIMVSELVATVAANACALTNLPVLRCVTELGRSVHPWKHIPDIQSNKGTAAHQETRPDCCV